MKGVLLSLVLTSLCLLQASDSINVQSDIDSKQLAGEWNLVALALAEGKPTNYNRRHIIVQPEDNGDLVYITDAYRDTECRQIVNRFTPSEQPGIYKKDETTIYFMKTDYSSYQMIFVDTSVMKVLHLLTREEEPSHDIIDIYKVVATSLHLPVDQIVYLHRAAPC